MAFNGGNPFLLCGPFYRDVRISTHNLYSHRISRHQISCIKSFFPCKRTSVAYLSWRWGCNDDDYPYNQQWVGFHRVYDNVEGLEAHTWCKRRIGNEGALFICQASAVCGSFYYNDQHANSMADNYNSPDVS